MRVLFFGDSITWGGYDTQGGWVDRLKSHYQQAFAEQTLPKHQLYNLGIGGETSDGLVKRIEAEIVARALPDKKPAIFVAIGLNDACFVLSRNEPEVTAEQYASNLGQIVRIAKKYADNLFLVGLTPIRDAEMHFRDGVLKQEQVMRYDKIMHDVAIDQDIGWIDVLTKLTGHEDMWTHDGVHPNDVAHELIATFVKPELEKVLTT